MKALILLFAGVLTGTLPVHAENSIMRIQVSVAEDRPGYYHIYAPFIPLNLHLSFNRSDSIFNGRPFSGNISRTGSTLTLRGPRVEALITENGGSYRIEATVPDGSPRQEMEHIRFTMYADRSLQNNGLWSYAVWGSGSQIRIQALPGRREYEISGLIDSKQFSPEGAALLSLIAAVAMNDQTSGNRGDDAILSRRVALTSPRPAFHPSAISPK